MSAAVSYERVRDQLQQLKLEAALGALDPVLEQAQKAEKLTVPVLDELLGIERGHRVYFLTLHDLVTRSRAHRDENRLDRLLPRPSPTTPCTTPPP